MTRPACTDTFVIKKRNLRNDYYSLRIGPYRRVQQCRPGQFVHVKLPASDILFRRAMSIAGISKRDRHLEIIFRVLGRGTRIMGRLRPGDPINILGPLGVAFSPPKGREAAIIVAGGIGVPPLIFMAERLVERGFAPKRIEFFYGGKTAADIIERTRIKRLGVCFHPVTEDGSLGIKGLVTEPLEQRLKNAGGSRGRLYACGPEPMLKAVDALGLKYGVPGQVSLEAPMPCGIGVCLGCVVELTGGGHARVCREGPVFEIGEVAL